MANNWDEGLLEKFNKIEKLHWWWEGRRKLISLLLEKEKPKRILDVGCGTGETLTYLKKLFPKSELNGVDLSDNAIKFSKSRGHKNIFKANALRLPFKDNKFDVVLLLDVIEHIKNHQKVINEAKRVLNSKGKVIITSPGLSFIWSKFDENQGHQRRYTRHEILDLAQKADLEMDFISYFNFLLSPPIIGVRLLSNLKPLAFLSSYDRSFNFDVAFKPITNNILKKVFVSEINFIRYIRFPIGISIAAVLSKK